jgi:Tfp pilus assembly protein PilO
MLPSGAEVSDLLAEIAGAAVRNEVAIVNFAPLGLVSGEDLTEVPFDLQVQGNYHQVGRFLADIGNLTRLVRPSVTGLEQVKIEGEPTREGREPPPPRYEVLATVRLSTYVPVGDVHQVDEEGEDAAGPPSTGTAWVPEESDAS